MKILDCNIQKFSFAEAMSNSSGKTSGSKFAGFIALVTGCLGFLVSIGLALFKIPEALALSGLSSGLISSSLVLFGYSKKKGSTDNTIENKSE